MTDEPLTIHASEKSDDYEILESEHWPPNRPKTPEGQFEILYLRVLPHWIFHKNDADPWPSLLHGHHNERPLKLDAITGGIYSIRTREQVQRLKDKALQPIQRQLLASKDFGERAKALLAATG